VPDGDAAVFCVMPIELIIAPIPPAAAACLMGSILCASPAASLGQS
jgi:hypothetical protein